MTAGVTYIEFDLDAYIETAVADSTHAFNFLKESGTISASLIFNVSHRIPGHDKLLSLLQERELPSQRRPVGQFVAEGRFDFQE